MEDLWVFGYGSLMWRPDFAFEESFVGELIGYHRALCVYSYVYRGCPEKPGLVMGLDEGGTCEGMLFRVSAARRDEVLDYLRAREQVTSVYLEKTVPVQLSRLNKEDHLPSVNAVTYVADRNHEQYAGKLDVARQLEVVLGASGQAGPNIDYVRNTAAHLKEIDIHDEGVFALDGMLEKARR